MKPTGFFLITFCFSNLILGQYKIKLEVKQPSESHTSDKIFIAGNFNNWDPSSKDHNFNIEENGTGYAEIILPAGNYEYKFTRAVGIKLRVQQMAKTLRIEY